MAHTHPARDARPLPFPTAPGRRADLRWLVAVALLAACSSEPVTEPDSSAGIGDSSATDGATADTSATDSGAPDTATADTSPPVGTLTHCAQGGALPSGLVEIAWDDGKAVSDVTKQGEWTIVGKSVRDAALHQSVRFDIDQPVRVHGFRVQYGHVPTSGEVKAGLYRDFGHNGFDFWSPDPIWEVSCGASEVTAGDWTTFKLPKPVLIDQPGLVFVAHRRQGVDGAAWAFDGSVHSECTEAQGCCDKFHRCHSAWNFPELQSYSAGGQSYWNWNGLSTTRPTDYLVRLVVEPLPKVAAKETLLQPHGDTKPGHRMAWGDYDNDGWDDLFDSTNKLYRNDKGTLVDVSEQVGFKKLDVKGNGGVWGDFDNDGHLDLFVFWENAKGGDTLLRNKGDGTFEDVTESAGLSDLQTYNTCPDSKGVDTTHTPTPAAAWVDVDADGKLDLYLANFICWGVYTYYFDTVWHNEGGGKFTSWTGKQGFLGTSGSAFAGRGANPADADGDGHVDLLVNNYVLHRNLYYRNNGDGTVSEVALKVGLGGHPVSNGGQLRYGHSIGAAWGDLNGDGFLDLVVANLAHPRFWTFSDKSQVLLHNGKTGKAAAWADIQGSWAIPVGDAGLRFQETHSVPVLGDFDNDGALDLGISATYDGRPSDFYWGVGDGTFELDVLHAGLTVKNGWGMATADIDHDGALDLAAKSRVYRNTHQGVTPGHWLQVRVVGDGKANRAAIGATVRVTAGTGADAKVWLRSVSGGNGQGCQDSQTQHVGLGDVTTVDRVDVTFPGGAKQSFKGPFKADQRLWLYESGKVHKGFAPPAK